MESSGRDLEPWDAPAFLCGWCKAEFSPTAAQRKHRRYESAHRSYCCATCQFQAVGAQKRLPAPAGVKGKKGPLRGPCRTCGEAFRSYGAKFYCSQKCYVKSDEFSARMAAHNKELNESIRRQAGAADPSSPTVTRPCPGCGEDFTTPFRDRGKRFCSNPCRRSYFAERFDRFVANPEEIALPQNYDEFLDRNELPCVVDGCEWVGSNLSTHCNHTHGITSDQLKEILGFNKGSGLVSKSLAQTLRASNSPRGNDAEAMAEMRPKAIEATRSGSREARAEAKEHSRKSSAELANLEDHTKSPLPCRGCGAPVVQKVVGRKLFCSVKCRGNWYAAKNAQKDTPLVCGMCSATFMGNRSQVRRAERGQAVFCTTHCRQRNNVRYAPHVRAKAEASQESK
jgi:hypothetical protein